MNNLTRNDLAVELSLKLDIPVDKSKTIVEATIDVLLATLASGKSVEFRGFGVFDVVNRKQKIGRNPRKPSAGQYLIPARRAVRFRAGKHLHALLNPEQ